jgi:DNA-binding winged helix-turn-helix (wHTH) protein
VLFRFENCEFHPASRRLVVNGQDHVLGGRAFDLLNALVENHDRVMRKDELYERVWPGVAVEPGNLQVQVWALRRVLGHHAIATVPRRGYRFMPSVERLENTAVQTGVDGDGRGLAATPLRLARLAQDRMHHPLITVTCLDPADGDAQLRAAAQLMAVRQMRKIWLIDAVTLTGHRRPPSSMPPPMAGMAGEPCRPSPPPARERLLVLLQRIARRPAVLVLLNGHAAEGLADAVRRLLEDNPGWRVMVCSTQALRLPGEKLLHWSSDPLPEALPPLHGRRPPIREPRRYGGVCAARDRP